MPNFGIKAATLDFLVMRAGTPASIELVSEEIDVSVPQASQALSSLVNTPGANVTRISNGIYAYTGPVAPTAMPPAVRFTPPQPQSQNGSSASSFTVVGKNKAGETLVRDANGTVYRLVEV